MDDLSASVSQVEQSVSHVSALSTFYDRKVDFRQLKSTLTTSLPPTVNDERKYRPNYVSQLFYNLFGEIFGDGQSSSF